MTPLVPHITPFTQRAVGWLTTLRASRLLARITYQKGKQKVHRQKVARATAQQKETDKMNKAHAKLGLSI